MLERPNLESGKNDHWSSKTKKVCDIEYICYEVVLKPKNNVSKVISKKYDLYINVNMTTVDVLN